MTGERKGDDVRDIRRQVRWSTDELMAVERAAMVMQQGVATYIREAALAAAAADLRVAERLTLTKTPQTG